MPRPMPCTWRPLFAGALLAALAGLATAQAPASGIYTCIDAKGRRLSADRPIAECSDREQTLRNPSGSVKAKVSPAPTAKERAELESKEKAAQQEQARVAEEKRLDRALLLRYPKPASHDKSRAAALAQVALVRQGAVNRVATLQAERTALLQELEFYKKDPSKAPPAVRHQMDTVLQGLAAQERLIAEQDAELKRVNARFDEQLLRLKPLWALQSPTPPAVSTTR